MSYLGYATRPCPALRFFGRWRRVFAALFAVAALAGCAADRLSQAQDDAVAALDSMSSPARALVREGHAEMVLTDRRWPTFEQARENRIDSASGDSPLYAHIRTVIPLGELALPADPDGRHTFSAYPHIYLQVGDTESLRILNTCYLALAPEELALRELVVPLAPPALGPDGAPADCWLAAANSVKSGERMHEIRLAGFVGQYDAWLPQANLLAVAVVRTIHTAAIRSDPPPQISPSLQLSPPTASLGPLLQATSDADIKVTRPASSQAAGSGRQPAVDPGASPPGSHVLQVQAVAPLASAVPAESANVRIVIHHLGADAAAEGRAREMKARLAAQGSWDVEVRPVPAPVSTDDLRIFFEADRQVALQTRDLLAAGTFSVRDFSHYRPLPRPGTIEIWLAATPPAKAIPAAPAAATIGRSASTGSGRRASIAAQTSGTGRFDKELLRLLLLPGSRTE
jgi:hypothetical protein